MNRVLYEYASDSPEINCCNREEKSVVPEFAEDEVILSVGLILVWSVSVDVGAEQLGCIVDWLLLLGTSI